MIKFLCPKCNASYEIEDEYAGMEIACPTCNATMRVPSPDAAENSGSGIAVADSVDTGPVTWVTCPHCWKRFDIREMNYISRHIDLLGDSVLGPEAQSRFLPYKFSPQGLALDEKGLECPEMACPYCHLKIPESMVDLPTSFFSIVGSPASGKSYFLTAMLWQCRKCLPKYFELNLADVDLNFNAVLNRYENTLFLSGKPDVPVALPKTELQGVGYSTQVLLDGVQVDLPTPFVFALTPKASHPRYETARKELERNIVLYDNAGEHFEPGREAFNNLATLHLLHSDGIIFLYDPLQDVRMRSRCSSDDPQANQEQSVNQLTLFHEMVSRIRKYTGLRATEKYRQPLTVVIAKFDAFAKEFGFSFQENDYYYCQEDTLTCVLDLQKITNLSFLLRQKLLQIAPEIVGAVESFSETVYFVPSSAFGHAPEVIAGENDAVSGAKPVLGIRPNSLRPYWVEVPFLLHLYLHGLIQGTQSPVGDAVEITQYRFSGDSVIFFLPGEEQRLELPQIYWGNCIYNTHDGKYYRVPLPEGMTGAKDSNKAAALDQQVDEEFWKS